MTKPQRPSATAVQRTLAGNRTCPENIGEGHCSKPTASYGLKNSPGLVCDWIIVFTCEAGHRWHDSVAEQNHQEVK